MSFLLFVTRVPDIAFERLRAVLRRPAASGAAVSKRPAASEAALSTKGGSPKKKKKGKVPAAPPKKAFASRAHKKPGCAKCRWLLNGCSACAPHLPRAKRKKAA